MRADTSGGENGPVGAGLFYVLSIQYQFMVGVHAQARLKILFRPALKLFQHCGKNVTLRNTKIVAHAHEQISTRILNAAKRCWRVGTSASIKAGYLVFEASEDFRSTFSNFTHHILFLFKLSFPHSFYTCF